MPSHFAAFHEWVPGAPQDHRSRAKPTTGFTKRRPDVCRCCWKSGESGAQSQSSGGSTRLILWSAPVAASRCGSSCSPRGGVGGWREAGCRAAVWSRVGLGGGCVRRSTWVARRPRITEPRVVGAILRRLAAKGIDARSPPGAPNGARFAGPRKGRSNVCDDGTGRRKASGPVSFPRSSRRWADVAVQLRRGAERPPRGRPSA